MAIEEGCVMCKTDLKKDFGHSGLRLFLGVLAFLDHISAQVSRRH
jgi:hypothetical protein